MIEARFWICVFILAALAVGLMFGLPALADVLRYRDLQRRLREERKRRRGEE